jgi:hypothetical protein
MFFMNLMANFDVFHEFVGEFWLFMNLMVIYDVFHKYVGKFWCFSRIWWWILMFFINLWWIFMFLMNLMVNLWWILMFFMNLIVICDQTVQNFLFPSIFWWKTIRFDIKSDSNKLEWKYGCNGPPPFFTTEHILKIGCHKTFFRQII